MSLMLPHLRPRFFSPWASCFARSEPRIQSGCRRKLKLGDRHDELGRTHIHSFQCRMVSTVSDLSVPLLDMNHLGSSPQRQYDQDPAFLSATFHKTLHEGQPDQIMNMFVDPSYAHLVGSLPKAPFVEAFRLLSPAHFVIPYREIYRPLHPTTARTKIYKSLESIFDKFASNIVTIVRIRESWGHPPSLAEYKHLLDCARSMGDRPMADSVWGALIDDPEVAPDRQCYNYYMEAMIWDHCYMGLEKYHLRVHIIPYAARRESFVRKKGFLGYGTGYRSVRMDVNDIFSEMTAQGISGDEETFVDLMLACARVGHIRGIKNALWLVWGVDVDALCHNDPNTPAAKPLDRSSLVYPTERLLFAVAHAFGTNSDIVAALRTINFISRSYDIPITGRVWLELFDRAFVLSRSRRGTPRAYRSVNPPTSIVRNKAHLRNEERKGKVSSNVLFQLCAAMLSSPYNVRPTVDMYRMIAKTAWDKRSLVEFLGPMRASYDLLKETRQKRKEARLVLEDYLARLVSPSGHIDPLLLQSRDFAEAVNTYDHLRLQTAQNTIIMERLARLLVIHRWWGIRGETRWERWHFPRMLEEWQDFLPEVFDVATTGGIVKFTGRSSWDQQYLNSHKMIPRRRRTPSTEPDFEEETPEVDDDFFWSKYRESSPLAREGNSLLNRVFWDICPSSKYVVSEDEVLHHRHMPRENETPSETQYRQLQMPILDLRKPVKLRKRPSADVSRKPESDAQTTMNRNAAVD